MRIHFQTFKSQICFFRKILDGIFEVCGVAEDMFRWQFSLKCKSNQKNGEDLDFDILGASAVLLTSWTRRLGRR